MGGWVCGWMDGWLGSVVCVRTIYYLKSCGGNGTQLYSGYFQILGFLMT